MARSGRPPIKLISKEELAACSGLSRNAAAEMLGIDLQQLRRLAGKHGMSAIFKNVRNTILTKEVLLNNDGLNAYAYSQKIGYKPATIYRAIRRHGLQDHYGLAKYAADFQG